MAHCNLGPTTFILNNLQYDVYSTKYMKIIIYDYPVLYLFSNRFVSAVNSK